MNWDETNFHTIITQLLATAGIVFGLVHPGTSFTVPDATVVAVSTVAAAIASGLHALHTKKTKTVTVTTVPAVEVPKAPKPVTTTTEG